MEKELLLKIYKSIKQNITYPENMLNHQFIPLVNQILKNLDFSQRGQLWNFESSGGQTDVFKCIECNIDRC